MAKISRSYRFCRALVRFWFALSFRKIRLLGGEKLPTAGPALLAVSHPASLLDALILVAAFDRPVSCLLPRKLLRGFWPGLWARWLNIIPYESTAAETPRRGVSTFADTLARKGALVVFADPALRDSTALPALRQAHGSTLLTVPERTRREGGERSRTGQTGTEAEGFALAAASMAIEAEARQFREGGAGPGPYQPPADESRTSDLGRGTGLVLLPVHLYLPVSRSQASELLIYVDSPLLPREHLIPAGPPPGGQPPPMSPLYMGSGPQGGPPPGLPAETSAPAGDLQASTRALGALLQSRWQENPFGLPAEDLKRFASDLEEVLRTNLEEDWASRTNWKQKVEGFQLSGFAAAWAEQANYLHPGRLAALRETLEAFRASRRRYALRQAEVEAARAWLGSPLRRGWVWFESAVGWPVALYGLGNHLLALLILLWTGLLEKENDRDRSMEWLSRGVTLLGCYAVQILLVDYLLGRSWAGYYAPTLPLTGLYLWRYLWLLRHRTRVAFRALLLPRQARRLRRRRQEFVAELNQTLQAHAVSLGVT